MAATVNLCKGKSVPKDAVGRQRARAAAAAALAEPGAVVSDDLFPLFHFWYGIASLVMCADGSRAAEESSTDGGEANADALGSAITEH